MKSKEHIGTVKYKKGLINAFKSIFGRRKEKAYEDIDENQISEDLKSLIGKV